MSAHAAVSVAGDFAWAHSGRWTKTVGDRYGIYYGSFAFLERLAYLRSSGVIVDQEDDWEVGIERFWFCDGSRVEVTKANGAMRAFGRDEQ